MSVVRWGQAGFGLFFRIIHTPLRWFGRGLFRIGLLPMYAGYIKLRQRIRTNPHLAGVRSAGFFFERYAMYFGLIALGIFGLTNNLFAKTVRPDEVGQGAIWTSFHQSEINELIV